MAFKTIAFCRVSTTQQDYTRQISDLLPLIEKDGFKEEEVYIIKHKESATKNDINNRKSIAELREVIEKNPIKGVYVTEISRLARRNDVLYAVLALLEERSIALVVLTPSIIRTFDLDGNSDILGHVVVSFLGAVAKQETDIKLNRQKSGYAQKVKDGKVVSSRVKFGYNRDKDGYAVINTEKAAIVIDIFKMYLDGNSVSAIWNKYNHTGNFKELSLKSGCNLMDNILRDTTYIGKNEFFVYPPILDNELFDKVQEKMNNNKMCKSKLKYIYYCQGLLKFNGHIMTPAVTEVVYAYRDFETGKTTGINMNAMDSLLWNIAAQVKASVESTNNAERYAAMKAELGHIEVKLEGIKVAKEENDKQVQRANLLFIKGKVKEDTHNFMIEDLEGQLKHLLDEEEHFNKIKVELNSVIQDKTENEWMQQTVDYNSIISITDDKTRQDIIKETIDHADVICTEKGVFDIWVYVKDPVMATQDWHYKYIQKGCKKHLYCIYDDDYYEDFTNGIEERIKRYQRKK